MVQWGRVLGTEPDDLSLITKSHMVEGKNNLWKVVR